MLLTRIRESETSALGHRKGARTALCTRCKTGRNPAPVPIHCRAGVFNVLQISPLAGDLETLWVACFEWAVRVDPQVQPPLHLNRSLS